MRGRVTAWRLICWLLCVVACLLTASAPTAVAFWPADVVNLFRPYVLWGAIGVGVACATTRRPGLIALSVLLAIANLYLCMAPALGGLGAAHGSAPGKTRLKVVTFNCLASNPNVKTVVAWVRRVHPDVLVLEELPPRWAEQLRTLRDVLPYRASDMEQTPADTDVFSRFPMAQAQAYRPAPDLRAIIYTRIRVGGRELRVFGMHPNTLHTEKEWNDRNAYLGLAGQWIAQTRGGEPGLVLGDWNTPPWSPIFAGFLRAIAMRSADSVLFPPVTRVLGAPAGVRIGSPIDHVAISAGVSAGGCGPGPELGSDHVPQVCTVEF